MSNERKAGLALPDAIERGSKLHPHCCEQLFFWPCASTDGSEGGVAMMACALGAAYSQLPHDDSLEGGRGGYINHPGSLIHETLVAAWPELLEPLRVTTEDWCGSGCLIHDLNLFGGITHLNDDHHWSRQQIADRLRDYKATLERSPS